MWDPRYLGPVHDVQAQLVQHVETLAAAYRCCKRQDHWQDMNSLALRDFEEWNR